jgi:hypothetical protein
MIKVEILANIISEYGEFRPGRPGHPTIVGIPDEKVLARGSRPVSRAR